MILSTMNNLNLKRSQNYLKYLRQEILFIFNILWYICIHPNHIFLIQKYSKRVPGITLENKIPWLTFLSVEWLEKNLNKNMMIFEWGSGGSTFFFSTRTKKVISIEHDKEWYKNVSEKITEHNIQNCDYFLVEPQSPDESNFNEYSDFIKKYEDNYFDVAIVDGKARNECIIAAKSKIRPGGHIILDNSERKIYKTGIETLKGWARKDFYGPGPHNHYFSETTVFTKPKDTKIF